MTFAPLEQERIAMEAPVLLVEILTPNDERETRTNIWAYATVPSVREILSACSTRIAAKVLRRREDGSGPEQPGIIPAEGTLDLASVGFTTPLVAFYRTTALAAG